MIQKESIYKLNVQMKSKSAVIVNNLSSALILTILYTYCYKRLQHNLWKMTARQ